MTVLVPFTLAFLENMSQVSRFPWPSASIYHSSFILVKPLAGIMFTWVISPKTTKVESSLIAVSFFLSIIDVQSPVFLIF